MKKFLLLVAMVIMAVAVMAQSTNKISYQAVVRDGNNRLVANETVKVTVTIGSYVEVFTTVKTNANGLMSLTIGNNPGFDAIDWSTATIKTDVEIGSETVSNTVPVTAVPYALYSSDVNPSGATVQAIYDKVKADSIVLATSVNNLGDKVKADSTALAGQINTLNNNLTDKIKADSTALAGQINTLNGNLTDKIKADSTALAGQINTLNGNLTDKIKADSTALAGQINTLNSNLTDKIKADSTALAGQITAVNTNLTDNYTKTVDLPAAIADQLSDTADNVRGEMTAKLADYTKTADIPAAIADQLSDTADNVRGEMTAKLADYTKTADIPAAIADQLSDTADNVRGEMTAKLADYTKTADLPAAIADQLSDTADNVRGEMTAKLADYTKTADIPAAIAAQLHDTANNVRAEMASIDMTDYVHKTNNNTITGANSFTGNVTVPQAVNQSTLAYTNSEMQAVAYKDLKFLFDSLVKRYDRIIDSLSGVVEKVFYCPSKVSDAESNVYRTVKIGTQCWMAENLRSTKYWNGSGYTNVTIGADIGDYTTARYAPAAAPYGNMYNWKAAMGSATADANGNIRGICPEDWHLPTVMEWTTLQNFLNGKAQYNCDGGSFSIAKSMASTTNWTASAVACSPGYDLGTNNASGFDAQPAAIFPYNGTPYETLGRSAFFWSASDYDGSTKWGLYMLDDNKMATVFNFSPVRHLSVRCVHD